MCKVRWQVRVHLHCAFDDSMGFDLLSFVSELMTEWKQTCMGSSVAFAMLALIVVYDLLNELADFLTAQSLSAYDH